MSDPIIGHIIGGPAEPDFDGSPLTVDLAVGDTVVQVKDVADFDEDADRHGGRLIIGVEFDTDGRLDSTAGTYLDYLSFDDDADTLTLAGPSTVAASAGDFVYLADPVTGDPVGDVIVRVAVDENDTTGDGLPAYLAAGLLETVGDADLTDMAVEIEEDEDGQLRIMRFVGLSGTPGGVKAMQDQITAAGPGAQTLTLTYRPITNSEHLYWNGLYQPGSEWARDGYTVTIPDDDSLFEAGDELVMEYLYADSAARVTSGGTAIYVGGTVIDNNATSIALPPGTQEGDILMLSMQTGGFGSLPHCSDSRITLKDGDSTDHLFVGVGVASASTAPIAISIGDGEHNGFVMLVAYRVTGTTGTPVVTRATSGAFTPTMPTGPAACLMIASAGYFGGSGRELATSPQDSWYRDQSTVGGSQTGSAWSSVDGAPPLNLIPGDLIRWVAITVGVSGA